MINVGNLAKKRIIPSSADEARYAGSPTYFSGEKCPQGHIAERYTSCHKCVDCANGEIAKKANQNWYKENGEVRNERKRKDRHINKAKYSRQQKAWRERNLVRQMLISAKSRAKTRGIEFNIELADIVIPETCQILGVRLKLGDVYGGSPSLDRIDNSKGYVKGNIAVISHRANIIKRDASINELERIVEYMRKHNQQ